MKIVATDNSRRRMVDESDSIKILYIKYLLFFDIK